MNEQIIKNIFDCSMILGILTGISLLVYVRFSTRKNENTIKYLFLFVLCLTLNNLQITLVDNGYIPVNFFVRKLLIPFYVLIVPFFYTFLSYYLKIEKEIKSFVVISIGLFILEIAIRIIFIPFYFNNNQSYVVAKYAQIEEIINAIYGLFLFSRLVILFFKQSKLYQYVATFDNVNWLKQSLLIGFFILMLWVVAIVFNLDNVLNPVIPIYYPLRFASTLQLYLMAYLGFFNYNLLCERIQLRTIILNDDEKKTQKVISTKESDQEFIFIQNHIITNKKYLDPYFSIDVLAQETKISSRNLSQILQKHTNYNFTDYVNELRIQKAKKYLINPDFSNYTIVAIGLECGFYSKSTFYRAFAKFTNTSPTDYRAENN